MSRLSRPRLLSVLLSAAIVTSLIVMLPIGSGVRSADAASFAPIAGTGSTWAQRALDEWRRQVATDYGMTVAYSGIGSSGGRQDFLHGTVDFAVSELPFQAAPEDGSAPEVPTQGYSYLPFAAGATSLAYNLIGTDGARITNLRLSAATTAGIFTGSIRSWTDPAIAAENPGTRLPAKPIVPVVRADGSGSTWQFTSWLKDRQPAQWNTMCAEAECPATSQFPALPNMKAQNGSLGVMGYVSQGYGEGGITYVENSYAKNSGFPVAKLLNAGGYYVPPTNDAVSIALLGASAETDPASPEFAQLRLRGVYENPDRRAYPLSSATYLIVPTEEGGIFTAAKGHTLGAFAQHSVCAGQRRIADLGYAPLPLNLVQQSLSQASRIPGASEAMLDGCDNPTFVNGDTVTDSLLTRTAPMPPSSDSAVAVPPSTERVSGADRYEAAVNVSKAAFPTTAPVVYVVTGANYPDALSAGPAAAHEGGPLLLTEKDALLPVVVAEITRLKPAKIVVVGGVNSVSELVLGRLRSLQRNVVRIGGADRYEASRNLASYAFGDGGAAVTYVATGTDFPDALSAGAAAASRGGPVVLVDGSAGSVDVATGVLLDSLAVQEIVIAGGPASVSAGMAASLSTIAHTARQGGADRFEASANINADAFPSAERAFLATGLKFPDALAGSAWAGSSSAPLYVARPDCVPRAVLDAMRIQRIERITLIGGPASLSPSVASLTPC
ncbi:cell wall-binding repeat-containing protein [Herbiconiux ginsengi]|uniref:Phosphate ABC transporter, phosphate-binding protein n=1 Tax=Herbiconiux ginsengi TaxID=381665 RepID=A0A1H3RH07_9MICO|nr:cell wall-binding repeat-containing protein [Herbiconiux ginsengi]SDZ24498.1 phosphate ABC transporter, phosphate-binding protein [Herbiconiux ginsengi]